MADATKIQTSPGFSVGENKTEMDARNVSAVYQAVNSTYCYSNSDIFLSMYPSSIKQYAYNYIRPACAWLDGYVPYIHSSESEVMSTRLASSLIGSLARQVRGERLVFHELRGGNHIGLHELNAWKAKSNADTAVYQAIAYAMGCGTSLLKLNKATEAGKYWWEAFRMDQCYFSVDYAGEVSDATFLIRSYFSSNPNGEREAEWVLVEHRYYQTEETGKLFKKLDGTYAPLTEKGYRTPKVRYEVKRAPLMQQQTDAKAQNVGWEEISAPIREAIKRDYGAIRIGEEETLPFGDLGIVALMDGEREIGLPSGACLGESKIIKAQSDFILYEFAESYKLRDLYLGKGTVYVPKSLTTAGLTGMQALNTPSTNIETIPGAPDGETQIRVNQFSLRASEWQTVQDDCLKNIAVKWKMSPKLLASFLVQGQASQTATQIDSEDDACMSFIAGERANFKRPINQLFKTTMRCLGIPADGYTIDFSSPSLMNKDRLIDRAIKLLETDLIDEEETLRMIFPDYDEEEISRLTEIALSRKKDKEKDEYEQAYLFASGQDVEE